MAEKIYDNISEISKAIKNLNKDAQEASKTTKSLNEDLKLDPTNIELAGQRFDALNRELQAYTAYQQKLIEHENALRSAQAQGVERLSTLDKSSDEYKKLEKELQLYNAELTKTEKSADRAASQIKRLQSAIKGIEIKKTADEAAAAKKKVDDLSKSMDALEKAGRKLQVALTLIVGTFTKLTKEAVEQGTELYALSKRYGANVEDIQKWNRALQLATGETGLFTNSLSVLAKGMSDIAGNRGQKYTAALRAIGLSYKTLNEQSREEQFRGIIEGLMAIENESVRAAHAQTLLGESGQYIVGALADGKYSLEEYLEQANRFSYITQKNAEAIANMGFQLEAAKSQLSVTAAQIALNLYPTIMQLINLLNHTLVPLLVGLSKMGWAIYIVIAALIALKVVPAITKWAIALMAAKKAQDSLNTSMLIGKAIAGGVIAVMTAAAAITGAVAMANQAASNSISDINSAYGGLGADLNTNIEQMTTQSTERTITMNVDIHGEGDTVVSDEAAQTVAQLTADELQKRWGDLVK